MTISANTLFRLLNFLFFAQSTNQFRPRVWILKTENLVKLGVTTKGGGIPSSKKCNCNQYTIVDVEEKIKHGTFELTLNRLIDIYRASTKNIP